MICLRGEHESALRSERRERGAKRIETGFIFAANEATPIDPKNFCRNLLAVCAAAALGRWQSQVLRHSSANLMLARGVKLHPVSQSFGLWSIRITSDVDEHLLCPYHAAITMVSMLWDADMRVSPCLSSTTFTTPARACRL